VGWSFGTELALKYGRDHDVDGVILLAAAASRDGGRGRRVGGRQRRMVVVVPEFDDYLRPAEARSVRERARRDAHRGRGRQAPLGGERRRRVLTEIVAAVNPDALPLPTEWDARLTRHLSFCRGMITWR
jgi:pimeloyl-ACP methyl ester carboxylesterase